jgi:predicted nicotinamide N-methyase
VAIAAAKAGANIVEACDIDEFSAEAIALNAEANGVDVQVFCGNLIGIDRGWDVVLAADVSYERDMAARVTDWLDRLRQSGTHVLIGDPGRSYLAKDRLEALATYRIPVTRALEDSEVKQTSVWAFR